MSDMQPDAGEGAVAPPLTPDVLERVQRHRRNTLKLLTLCAVCLVPWTILLALTLPSGYTVHQWRVTWVGFDILLVAAIASTAVLGWLRHRAVIVSGLASAVLLICDAWFDVSLDFGTSGVWLAAAFAAFAELPLAVYLIHRVMGMISLAQWPTSGTPADGDQQPAAPDA